ncbi:MAG: adenylyltransferase/cytidyltransferase family protein [Chitinivibrionales bacterium]|nr:adenylyltransferase/cytidyltransferase family protein [Chitinivibrionales bacterium]MBD3397239.1 adenylyltransferase/cytidyltransferase family protein [Chitinivibrionales bacterium]
MPSTACQKRGSFCQGYARREHRTACRVEEIVGDTPQYLVFENVEQVRKHVAPLRAEGHTLVTTNGCFDLIHAGHIRYLSEAAAEGDILVVGINSDASVRKLKGPDRPVQSEKDRALIVAGLKSVSCSFLFGEDDPRAFLEVLKPDVHVKGGDYGEDIIEKPVVEAYGGKISIVSFVPGRSTSEILRGIRGEKT